MIRVLVCCLASGCVATDAFPPSVALVDNGTTLTITSCKRGLIECSGSAEPVTAVADGQQLDVPAFDGLGLAYDHRISIATPSDPQIEVTDNGISTGILVELPAFAFHTDSALTRGTLSALAIDFDALPDATTSAAATTTCDNMPPVSASVLVTSSTRLEVSVVGAIGHCAHLLAVTQTVAGNVGSLETSLARQQSFELTSDP
jgi:hypothetical protein